MTGERNAEALSSVPRNGLKCLRTRRAVATKRIRSRRWRREALKSYVGKRSLSEERVEETEEDDEVLEELGTDARARIVDIATFLFSPVFFSFFLPTCSVPSIVRFSCFPFSSLLPSVASVSSFAFFLLFHYSPFTGDFLLREVFRGPDREPIAAKEQEKEDERNVTRSQVCASAICSYVSHRPKATRWSSLVYIARTKSIILRWLL